MTKIIQSTIILSIIILSNSRAAAPAPLIFSNQVITVQASQLSLDAVRYSPEAIVTNTTMQWVDTQQITTNGLFAGGGYATNAVSMQQPVTSIATNAAHWVAQVKFVLPHGYQWALNSYPVVIDRFAANIDVALDPAAVETLFGDAYPGLLFAATSGNYQPTGQIRDGFLLLGAQALAGGGQ